MTLKDAEGKPVSGTAVLAIYDKSLEAITGGSNVGPIHENFWKWKNNYYGHGGANSLPHPTGNLLRPKATGMQSLGRFGDEDSVILGRSLGRIGFRIRWRKNDAGKGNDGGGWHCGCSRSDGDGCPRDGSGVSSIRCIRKL